MTSDMIQIIVLAAIALFLVLRLRSVLGTRDGFEKTDRPTPLREVPTPGTGPYREEAEEDADIAAHAEPGNPTYAALAAIKAAEPGFSVDEFLSGARQAYEMIISGYESGDLSRLRGLLSPEVQRGFEDAIAERARSGLTVEARFIGVRAAELVSAHFDPATRLAEITLRLTGELTSVVRNREGEVVEGDPTAVRRQTDIFTFERKVGSSDPNWTLVSTGA